jgi:hypothetical protein
MSLAQDGQRIQCDGENCPETALLPVGLRPVLSQSHEQEIKQVDGWLFVLSQDVWHHYCHRCTQAYLGTLANPPELPDSSGSPHKGRISPDEQASEGAPERGALPSGERK